MPDSDLQHDRKETKIVYSENETNNLFREYIQNKNPEIRDKLTMMHQNLVRFLAGKFANRGEPIEDLIQVGVIGLINAIDRFDPDRGNKFSTYATPTIVGEIQRHFRDKAWSLKVPRHLQDINRKANKAAEELTQTLGMPPTITQIAQAIGRTEEETLEAMELGNAYDTVSLDSKLFSETESAQLTLAEFLGMPDEELETIESHGDLQHAMQRLEPRERAIIYFRFFKDMSQTEVAKRLAISQMHVSRLQQRALRRLKELLSS